MQANLSLEASFCHPQPPSCQAGCTSQRTVGTSAHQQRKHDIQLGFRHCQHSKANPVCKVDVVLHDLQCTVYSGVVSRDATLKLIDRFRYTTKVSNDGVVQRDLARGKQTSAASSALEPGARHSVSGSRAMNAQHSPPAARVLSRTDLGCKSDCDEWPILSLPQAACGQACHHFQ